MISVINILNFLDLAICNNLLNLRKRQSPQMLLMKTTTSHPHNHPYPPKIQMTQEGLKASINEQTA